MSISKLFGKLYLKLGRWTTVGEMPSDIKKCVIIVAPHTSIDDFIIGRAFYWVVGTPVRFMIKSEAFRNPIAGWMLRKMGGIPVNRGHQNNLVEQMVELFNKTEVLNLVITPEATRKLVHHWKKGFYYIAEGAKVPIVLGFIDFQKRRAGYGPVVYPSGDFEADMLKIEDFYKDIKGKHPERFNLDEQYRTQQH